MHLAGYGREKMHTDVPVSAPHILVGVGPPKSLSVQVLLKLLLSALVVTVS